MINTGYTSSNSSSDVYAHWHWTHIATAAADPLVKTCASARGTTNAYWYYYGNSSYAQASNQTLYVSAAGSNTYSWWEPALMCSQTEVLVLVRDASPLRRGGTGSASVTCHLLRAAQLARLQARRHLRLKLRLHLRDPAHRADL